MEMAGLFQKQERGWVVAPVQHLHYCNSTLLLVFFFPRWEQEGHPLLEFIRKEPNSLCTDEKKARKEKKHERTNHILYMLVLH